MPYKALKPCKFDKEYSIGDEIPAAVVDRSRSKFLEEIGIIAPLGSDDSLDLERGFVAPEKTTKVVEENKADKLPEAKKEKVEKLSKSQLKKMDKAELTEYAATLGLELEGLTNSQMIEAILIAEEQKEGE